MWPVSPAFLQAIRKSHQAITRVDLYEQGVPIETDVPVSSGSLTLTLPSNVRATADFTLPLSLAGAINPYLTDAVIRQGIRWPTGAIELVPMGTFRCFTSEVSRPGAVVKITGADWGELVAANHFVKPYRINSGADVTTAIAGILSTGYEHLTVEDRIGTGDTLTHPVTYEGDRWDAINALADSIDALVYVDRRGVAVIESAEPGDPVWTVDTGPEGVMVDYVANLTREGQANVIVCTGDNPQGGKAWAKAEDTDVGSPTAVNGWYGNRVLTFSDQSWTTNAKCQKAANKRLRAYSGLAQTVQMSSVPNYALDPDDTILVRFAGGSSEQHQITQLQVGLGSSGAMRVDTRLKRVDV